MGDDRRAEGDVGDEMTVHDVEVDPVGAGGVDGGDLGAQPGEIGGQDGGGDAQGLNHGGGPVAVGMPAANTEQRR